MKNIAAIIMAAAFALLGVIFLSGCSSFGGVGLTLETQYGKFRYELPEPKGTKK
jgi:outer membrane murein-binding lipoprotein Lpp